MPNREHKHKGKAALPQKLCANCHRPFYWRKKWQRDWQNVIYCSKRCFNEKRTHAS
ncbi:DUF2256 domain-containing protein [Paraglaciecola sp. L3A3]|uniref:DUF2256 domain-containing protein n=1 Tax=Paraglaciecola sp. L3A3 TaxID=2686358 RepID=UPI00131E6739|nr:DUF2256 domain-containing protein [Paraglaciecola sp. L3A3]